jgi:peroxiredoxin Q/BCP
MLTVGQKAPDFSIKTDDGSEFKLSNHFGKKVIVYFYPKDDTPGCTTEACDFRESISQFNQLGCVIIGISRDSIESHKKFKEKYSLNFPLGSDENGDVCRLYGTWTEKSMFGKKYFGVQRSTFLINEEGIVTHTWPKVSVSNHIKEILSALKS